MPVCHVCDGEDFDLLDGLYFCCMCSTQSQQIKEQDYEDVMEITSGKILDKNKGNMKGSTRVYHKADRGKPWYTVEGFQVILQAQVNSMLKLGCDSSLRDAVKQIWFKFIHESGIVVINPKDAKSSSKPCTSLRFRDEYLSGILEKEVAEKDAFPSIENAVKLRLTSHGNLRRKRKLSNSSSDDDVLGKHKPNKDQETNSQFPSDEEWFSLASSDDSSDSEEEAKSSKQQQKPNKHEENAAKRRRSKACRDSRRSGHLNLQNLIAILFVGLQWCKELITLGDLIMWIRQGYLPFIDCISCLLPHMKLTNYDMNAFNPVHVPSYAELLFYSRRLIKRVEMPDMPDVDVQKLVTRYIVQLNLPLALVAFVRRLFEDKLRFSRAQMNPLKYYMPDLVAASEIVIALKLLLGLDDEREWSTDETSTTCTRSASDQEAYQCRPFLWREWYGYHLQRRSEAKQNPSDVFVTRNVQGVEDVHSYVEHWRNVVLKPLLAGKEKEGCAKSTVCNKELLATRRWAFDKLCAAQGSLDEMEERKLRRVKYPYVFPSPGDKEDMSKRCIRHMVRRLMDPNTCYVRYADRCTRAEFCLLKEHSHPHCSTSDQYRVLKPHEDFHQSYEFILLLCHEITCAPRILIHDVVRDLERGALSEHLTPTSGANPHGEDEELVLDSDST